MGMSPGSRVGRGVVAVSSSGSVLDFSLVCSRFLRSRRLGSLISRHLLVHHFQGQALQINTGRMLDKVAPQQLKSLEVPAEEHRVVLVSLLESFNGPGCDSLELVSCHKELLILLQR